MSPAPPSAAAPDPSASAAATTALTIPRVVIAAPASGHGKTTITAALARLYRSQGKRVRVFKTGPDFLDPMVLEQASGQPVVNLALWLGGEDHGRSQGALSPGAPPPANILGTLPAEVRSADERDPTLAAKVAELGGAAGIQVADKAMDGHAANSAE